MLGDSLLGLHQCSTTLLSKALGFVQSHCCMQTDGGTS